MRLLILVLLSIATNGLAFGETRRVPEDHDTIQAAINESQPGDIVLVSPGIYRERLKLKPGITLRSVGDGARTADGLERAKATIIEGEKSAKHSGVMMAEDSTLDGFTITSVGLYDETLWQQHFDSHGEDLADDEGSVQAEGTNAAVSIQGVNCKVTNCIVHHNGDVGISVLGAGDSTITPIISDNIVFRNMGGGIGVANGAEPVICGNTCKDNLRAGIGCRNANPIITKNLCFQNTRAGIGCREGAKPVIRGNKCYQNRRAGIGIRMERTSPVVEDNECFENAMAGIGCRNGATPILRNNTCSKNLMAGIGCREGAKPLIIGNRCLNNAKAGIGVEQNAVAKIHGNKCLDNKLVAIGVTGQSSATITENELSRTGGMPPIIAVKDDSTATVRDNQIQGGGVAAVLVQGSATISNNTFTGNGPKRGNAVWVWENSTATVFDNSFIGYRTAVKTKKATISIINNKVSQFGSTAFVVKDSKEPAHVYGNAATSTDAKAIAVEITGPTGVVADNDVSITPSSHPEGDAK